MTPSFILLGIGAFLIIAELVIGSFFLMFFGIGFLLVGILSFFLFFGWMVQILIAFLLSILLLFTLKRPLKERFNKNDDKIKDDFLNESGEGVVRNGMVYYKGTFWQSPDILGLKDGDRVEVVGTLGNQIQIKVLDIEAN